MAPLSGALKQLNEAIREVQAFGADVVEHEQAEEADSFLHGEIIEHMEEVEQQRTQHQDEHLTEELMQTGNANKKQKVFDGAVAKASEAIIETSTRQEYARTWTQFEQFLQYEELVDERGVQGILQNIPREFPVWICAWIMSRADIIDIHTGAELHPGIPRVSYSYAQKMRAAITHKFAREFGLGPAPWVENALEPGRFSGNPSISPTVSQYMISLHRRKVRYLGTDIVKQGEVVTSARAITEDIMKRLYDFNQQVPLEAVPQKRKNHPSGQDAWAGYCVRTMLHCLYTISMLCLLRYDEALNIRWEDITFGFTSLGLLFVKIDLSCRKTHQFGGIAPFYLYLTLDRPHMCAVLALARWWILAEKLNLQRYGYIFRKRIRFDELSINPNDQMSSDSFLACFRNNLCDIGVDPRLYGTHSFRRGGCQYLHTELRWPIRDICAWGGWSENFDSPGTIFKYLLSWTDTPRIERTDYFNPNRKGTNPCSRCNRTCNCA
ncbi:hypothetical protein NM688_g6236 [Phlebia brevispora]|uniref:Uncharacterized protein n=1 Tax=Phlebia brevispora TaxID=194682 RepID=A0ACC1SIG3_9APHY|nr:hypothetical protein NM688_g6236 [Phlebia brevispora]